MFSEDKIIKQVLYSTDHLIPDIENLQVPIDINYLASCLGYTIEEAKIQQQGYITETKENKRLIRVRINDPLRIKRFTIAHEIGHILLNIYENKPVGREKKYRFCSYSQEERLADRIAAELLMPVSRFRYELSKYAAPSFSALGAIAGIFNVSLSTCLRRITELSDFIGFSYSYAFSKEFEDTSEIRLRNRYSSKPNLRFVEKPYEVIKNCYYYSLSKGRNWEGRIKMIAEHQMTIPAFANSYKEKDKLFMCLSGWKRKF